MIMRMADDGHYDDDGDGDAFTDVDGDNEAEVRDYGGYDADKNAVENPRGRLIT